MYLKRYILIILVILPQYICKNETSPMLNADGEISTDLEVEEEEQDEEKNNAAEEKRRLEEIRDAIRDVAYYLRSAKFNDFDRRYHLSMEEAKKRLYQSFPDPPLRTIHWEVKENCQEKFLDCIKYLQDKISLIDLRRDLDTTYVMLDQNWTIDSNRDEVNRTEIECQKLYELDWNTAPPFAGPLERFQWRTSASYYMCWYTMNELPELAHFEEACDNLGHCLPNSRNGDIRASDEKPFACAMYSFCPDPCCPNQIIIQDTKNECWMDESQNPCYHESPGDHECHLIRYENRDFASGVLNRWNVTCKCSKEGYQWDSRFGICTDVDECISELKCEQKTEECLNLPGGYTCICKWGLVDENDGEGCVPNTILALAEKQKDLADEETIFEGDKPIPLGELFMKIFHKNKSNNVAQNNIFHILLIKILLIRFYNIII